MLVSTDGLPGPVMVNRLGKPAIGSPGRCAAPRSTSRASARPPRPRMSISSSAPVMASKPVAKTMASTSYSRPLALTPRGVISSIGDLADVDQGDVGPVEGLVVADVDAQPLAADGVLGRQQLGDLRVAHALADLVAHELCRRLVGLLVDHQVVVGAEEPEPAVLPAPLELALALLGRGLQRRLVGVVEVDAGHGLLGARPQRRIVGLDGAHVLRVQRRVVRRDGVVGRALEHGEVRGLLGDDRDRLHGGRAGADDRDALAGEVDALLRPVAGVVAGAREGVEARELRRVGRGQAARGHDAVGCRHAGAVARSPAPSGPGLVEGRRLHARVELDVAAQVEAVGDVVGVAQDLGLRGVALAPLPLLLQRVENW